MADVIALISPKFNLLEVIAFAVFVIGLLLKEFASINAGMFIVLALGALSIIYFMNSFTLSQNENVGLLHVFLHKGVYLSLSITVIGILFRLSHWPHAFTMLYLGGFVLALLLPVLIIINRQKPELKLFDQRVFMRIIVALVLAVFLIFTTSEAIYSDRMNNDVHTEITE